MKICYLANTGILSTNASAIQIVKMCEAFSELKNHVTLITTNSSTGNIFDFYNVKSKFKFKKIKYFKKFPLGIKYYLFSILSIIESIKHKPDIYITRNFFICYLLLLFKKKVILEIHHDIKIEGRITRFITKYLNFLNKSNIINKDNIRAWQSNIGYVPQQIYLADTSISNNIAFGVNTNNIRKVDVEKAAKVANIHEFVVNELPLKYETIIGERGVRFSGGQRQRIGIARALYHNPKLLVMDESTSALDSFTEQSVINEIYNLRKNITIIMISHRLSTLEKCDKIFLFEKGKLKSQGSYSEIIAPIDIKEY